MTADRPVFTIGHSNRTLEAFVTLLKGPGVERVVDIRTVPRSRANPQFNRETLPDALGAFGVAYEHVAELGGLRGRSKTVPREVNALWTNESFHNYADYALTPEYSVALDRLRTEGRRQRCAIMCSEAVWWRCHRRIVADYLIAAGFSVVHIFDAEKREPATLTPGAEALPGGSLRYAGAEPLLL